MGKGKSRRHKSRSASSKRKSRRIEAEYLLHERQVLYSELQQVNVYTTTLKKNVLVFNLIHWSIPKVPDVLIKIVIAYGINVTEKLFVCGYSVQLADVRVPSFLKQDLHKWKFLSKHHEISDELYLDKMKVHNLDTFLDGIYQDDENKEQTLCVYRQHIHRILCFHNALLWLNMTSIGIHSGCFLNFQAESNRVFMSAPMPVRESHVMYCSCGKYVVLVSMSEPWTWKQTTRFSLWSQVPLIHWSTKENPYCHRIVRPPRLFDLWRKLLFG